MIDDLPADLLSVLIHLAVDRRQTQGAAMTHFEQDDVWSVDYAADGAGCVKRNGEPYRGSEIQYNPAMMDSLDGSHRKPTPRSKRFALALASHLSALVVGWAICLWWAR